ncbi:glutathione-regulated potassium-efflux system protein KefC [Oscillatoria sp. FACHB-1407]|uniref:glutathione-regulated potassium-efflux system protein KefC n=1 Tax=Oscillatoria sp. FACHB-1407 TaxID=2692847 RepID=UPI001682B7C0|nr:glutathione-regulated potassium-efflux system protein KefC [Oscillatoria sp. FACHB-1407]MBD2461221.1 glutathione-regulated potassium-efflux system protein KefC [Oscillatoria sp. FACHB-1407]
MYNEGFFFQAFIYLTAAVLSVPIAKRLGLGSVLGYLIAGVLIGPFGLRLVGQEGEDVMHFAEFGVVMMLFLVGLELQPELLWRLRVPILGLGGLQVVVTTLVFAVLGLLFGVPWQMAIAIGMILAMSSTAIVLQTLNEKGLSKTEGGQSAFSVLLFQDIAVIPILAFLPLLAVSALESAKHTNQAILVAVEESTPALPPWQQALLVMGVVGGIIVGGRFLMRPVFRFIAATRLREIFTATALLLVIGIALAMQQVGLSPALGTFVAGVVLADNEYRHELESDIDPFKGLLLGLFFISVGASINFNLLFQQPLLILGLVVVLAIAKFAVLFALGRFFRLQLSQGLLLAFALAQGGEFAFVLFSFATQTKVLTPEIAAPLVAVVALSMMLTPLLMIVNERFVQPRFANLTPDRDADEIDDNENPVIIAGFGRFGQIIGRLLIANGCTITVLDHNPTQIELLRRFDWKVFYGDAARLDLLHAAGAERAKLLVIAIDERDTILEIVDLAHKHYPHLKILARAIDRRHAYELIRREVDVIQRETFDAALNMGVEALRLLGVRSYRAHRAAQTFKHHDEEALHEIAMTEGDETFLVARSRQLAQDLAQLLQTDEEDFASEVDLAWDTSAVRKDLNSR